MDGQEVTARDLEEEDSESLAWDVGRGLGAGVGAQLLLATVPPALPFAWDGFCLKDRSLFLQHPANSSPKVP